MQDLANLARFLQNLAHHFLLGITCFTWKLFSLHFSQLWGAFFRLQSSQLGCSYHTLQWPPNQNPTCLLLKFVFVGLLSLGYLREALSSICLVLSSLPLMRFNLICFISCFQDMLIDICININQNYCSWPIFWNMYPQFAFSFLTIFWAMLSWLVPTSSWSLPISWISACICLISSINFSNCLLDIME